MCILMRTLTHAQRSTLPPRPCCSQPIRGCKLHASQGFRKRHADFDLMHAGRAQAPGQRWRSRRRRRKLPGTWRPRRRPPLRQRRLPARRTLQLLLPLSLLLLLLQQLLPSSGRPCTAVCNLSVSKALALPAGCWGTSDDGSAASPTRQWAYTEHSSHVVYPHHAMGWCMMPVGAVSQVKICPCRWAVRIWHGRHVPAIAADSDWQAYCGEHSSPL